MFKFLFKNVSLLFPREMGNILFVGRVSPRLSTPFSLLGIIFILGSSLFKYLTTYWNMQAFENLYFVLINSSIPFQLSNIPIANFCFPISLQSSAFHRISIPLSLSMSPSFPLSLPTAYHSNPSLLPH
uniref:Uncharacterized protein n=1 Tax=Cacopsylla melanoneura TaxID=428564 RepID=A0A8D9F4U5_9HEMI